MSRPRQQPQDASLSQAMSPLISPSKRGSYSSLMNAHPSSQGLLDESDEDRWSLSVNYMPSKFSPLLLAPGGMRNRRGGGSPPGSRAEVGTSLHSDEDEDGKKMRWNRFKWTLFAANLVLTTYSLITLIFCLLTWFNIGSHADIIRISNRSELVISTIASCLGLFTSVLGWAGILLNNRSFLAIYTFLLWIIFAFLVAPGYIAYRRRSLNLLGKLNKQWSRDFGAEGRLRVQNQLSCCGYFSPFVEATVSQSCYARTILPGCIRPFLDFQRQALKKWYTIAFALVPAHIFVMVSALLCSNHVTYRFGKGMMPKAYRFSEKSMRAIMEKYARQLAKVHGPEFATDVLNRTLQRIYDGSNGNSPKTTISRAHGAAYVPSPLGRQPGQPEVPEKRTTPPTPPAKQRQKRDAWQRLSLLSPTRSPPPPQQQRNVPTSDSAKKPKSSKSKTVTDTGERSRSGSKSKTKDTIARDTTESQLTAFPSATSRSPPPQLSSSSSKPRRTSEAQARRAPPPAPVPAPVPVQQLQPHPNSNRSTPRPDPQRRAYSYDEHTQRPKKVIVPRLQQQERPPMLPGYQYQYTQPRTQMDSGPSQTHVRSYSSPQPSLQQEQQQPQRAYHYLPAGGAGKYPLQPGYQVPTQGYELQPEKPLRQQRRER